MADMQRRKCTIAKHEAWGRTLNPEVCFQVKDGFDEGRGTPIPEMRRTSQRRNEHRTGSHSAAHWPGPELARHHTESQRPCGLIAQVATRRRREEVKRERCRLRRAARHRLCLMFHVLRPGMHWAASPAESIPAAFAAHKATLSARVSDKLLRIAGRELMLALLLPSHRPGVCDLRHAAEFDGPLPKSFTFVDALKVARLLCSVVPSQWTTPLSREDLL